MKLSTGILVIMLCMLVAGLLASNIILKKEYDKVDKSDVYWTYRKILTQPFRYLKIEGGNITNIAFEQSANCSLRVLEEWQRYHEGVVKAFVKNDTLFVKFTYTNKNMDEKIWMRGMTLVRIFSPELLTVNGFNTKLEMFKMKQKSFTVNMAGRSSFEVESMVPDLDTLNVSQKDSSVVVFEMSPEYKSEQLIADRGRKALVNVNTGGMAVFDKSRDEAIKSDEAMTIQSVAANLQGYTLLDLGHAQVNSLQLNIADSSAIILSGGALRKLKH